MNKPLNRIYHWGWCWLCLTEVAVELLNVPPSLKICFMSLHQTNLGLTSQKLALRLLVFIHSTLSLPWKQAEISNSNTVHILSNAKSRTLMFSFLKALRSIFPHYHPNWVSFILSFQRNLQAHEESIFPTLLIKRWQIIFCDYFLFTVLHWLGFLTKKVQKGVKKKKQGNFDSFTTHFCPFWISAHLYFSTVVGNNVLLASAWYY